MKPVSGKIDRTLLARPISPAEKLPSRKLRTLDRTHRRSVRDAGEARSRFLMPMRAWTESVRRCWRSAGPYSRRRWDWTTDSPRLVGTRSSLRALAQRLQAAGWVAPVRALLTDCNTARKVANRPRLVAAGRQGLYGPCEIRRERRRARRGRGRGALHRILHHPAGPLRDFLVFPALGDRSSASSASSNLGTIFTTASLWAFMIDGFFALLAGPRRTFRQPCSGS